MHDKSPINALNHRRIDAKCILDDMYNTKILKA